MDGIQHIEPDWAAVVVVVVGITAASVDNDVVAADVDMPPVAADTAVEGERAAVVSVAAVVTAAAVVVAACTHIVAVLD